MVEVDLEDRIAHEGQFFAAGCHVHHAVSRRVPPRHARRHALGHLHRLIELDDVFAVDLHEGRGRLAQGGRHGVRHHRLAEVRILPERHFPGRHVNAHVRAQPGLDAGNVQAADVVHVHVRDHDVGNRGQVDTGRFQAHHRAAGAREIFETVAHAGVDQDQPVAAAHQRDIQRPVEHVTLQETAVEPCVALGFADVGRHGGGGQRQHAVADQHDVELAHAHGVAGRHEFACLLPAEPGDDRPHIASCFAHFQSSS